MDDIDEFMWSNIGLDEVGIDVVLHGHAALGVLVEIREHNDSRVWNLVLAVATECIENVDAAHLGEHDIEKHEVVGFVDDSDETVVPVDNPVDIVAFVLEATDIHFADEAIVFDYQN